MKFLLSFAVGAILGDIFFHLIPESFDSYISELNDVREVAQQKVGLGVITGIFMFIIVEMVLEKWSQSVEKDNYSSKNKLINPSIKGSNTRHLETKQDEHIPIFKTQDLTKILGSAVNYDINSEPNENNNILMANLNHAHDITSDVINNNITSLRLNQHSTKGKQILQEAKLAKEIINGFINSETELESTKINQLNKSNIDGCQIIDTAGYLNLIANGFDNFTHGLAIGASFLVGPKVGLLTTFVIFIHEIPHEICDYAILVNSGFSRWDAVKAQSSVSLFGILGTAISLSVKSVQTLNAKTVWILPFSAGGFLYIALVNLLPEILERDTNSLSSFKQIAGVILGVAFMAAVAVI